jgi:hypothetical protein
MMSAYPLEPQAQSRRFVQGDAPPQRALAQGLLLRGVVGVVVGVVCVLVFGVGVAGAKIGYGDGCSLSVVFCTAGEFQTPIGVAVDNSAEPGSAGDVYVADYGGKRVVRFDGAGKELGVIEPPGGFANPIWDAVDPSNGDLYVSDYAGGVVDKFTPSGTLVASFGTGGQLTGFSIPAGVAVDPSNGDLFVAERGAPVIKEYDSSGKLLGSFSAPVLEAADSLAVNAAGDVYEVDEKVRVVEYPAANRAEPVVIDSNRAFSVAVEPGTEDVLIDENVLGTGSEIVAYSPGGTRLYSFGLGDFRAGGSAGIAVNGSTHTVYASDIEGGFGIIFNTLQLASATTGAAKSIGAKTAELCGTVNPESETLAAGYQFEYGPDTSYGSIAPAQPASLGTGLTPHEVCATVKGLNPVETYHYQLIASNSEGRTPGGDESFKTLAAPASVDSQSAALIEQTSTIVKAQINPEHSPSTFHIEYGTSTAYGSTTPLVDATVGSGLSDVPVEEQLTALKAGTTYHYRIVATNTAGSAQGPDGTFTTAPPTPPIVQGIEAVGITQSSVTLAGVIDPQGTQTSYEFDLGTDTNYGTRVFGEAGTNRTPQAVAAALQGLAPGTTYHYRLLASNVYGSAYSEDHTFTTPQAPPSATLTAPLTPALVPVPSVAFPSATLTTSAPKSKKPKSKKKKKAKKASNTKGVSRARKANHAHGTHRRGK